MHFATRTPAIIFLLLALALPADSLTAGPDASDSGEFLTYEVRQGDTLLKICSDHRNRTNH